MARRVGAAAAVAVALLLPAMPSHSRATLSQSGNLRVQVGGRLSPKRLPRQGLAPVSAFLSGDISTTDGSAPPQLEQIVIALNRHGRLDVNGLPRCHYHQIQPASTVEARLACAGSLVGTGSFRANVVLPEQSPFPSNGRVLAFNGTLHGHPVIYAHIFGKRPVPISQVVTFRIHRADGRHGVVLKAELPDVAAEWGYVSGLSLGLSRVYRFHGRSRSYLAAGCPAPKGFSLAIFPFARGSFSFDDGRVIDYNITRTCRVR